jgi:hypothetical protein
MTAPVPDLSERTMRIVLLPLCLELSQLLHPYRMDDLQHTIVSLYLTNSAVSIHKVCQLWA